MSQQLIDRNPALKKMRDEGYEVEISGGYLIIHHIPYVNSNREIMYGKLVAGLSIQNDIVLPPPSHVIDFSGEYPCHRDGSPIEALRNSTLNLLLPDGTTTLNFRFSNKPQDGYKNHYDQFTRYIEIISNEAVSLDNSVTPKSFRVIESKTDENVFQYIDTHESRANIAHMNNKFKEQKIAIVGLGGTGSYILDLISKTPVAEIHLFDGDKFYQHNAFRAPGAPSKAELDKGFNKVDYYNLIYSRLRRGIITNAEYITEDNLDKLKNMSIVFICVDSNKVKRLIITYLAENSISFIDVGLGVNIQDGQLIGCVRTTTGTLSKNDHLENRIGYNFDNDENNEYSTNIQISDLNALNGILAVIKWKKLCGFYQDLTKEYHTTYSINDGLLLNEEIEA